MPYLHSRIADKHKARCKDPKSKRLYIRDYDEDTKKRVYTPLGIFCPSCKVIIFDSEPLSVGVGVGVGTSVKPSIDDSKETQVEVQLNTKPEPKPVLKLKPEFTITKPPPVKKVKKNKEMSLKELSKYGTIVKCAICNKNILQGPYLPFLNPRLPDAPPSVSNRIGLGGKLTSMTIFKHYPDGKTVEDEKPPFTHVCWSCDKKHFEQSFDNPERKCGEPITAVAKKLIAEKCTVPFPTKIISK